MEVDIEPSVGCLHSAVASKGPVTDPVPELVVWMLGGLTRETDSSLGDLWNFS